MKNNYRPKITVCPGCGLGGYSEGENCACGFKPGAESRSRTESRGRNGHQALLDTLAVRWHPTTPQQRLLELYKLKGKWLSE